MAYHNFALPTKYQQRQQVQDRRNLKVYCSTQSIKQLQHKEESVNKRKFLGFTSLLALQLTQTQASQAAALPSEEYAPKILCDESCEKNIESFKLVTTPSGLQYRDIREGTGPYPYKGFQAVVNYIGRTPDGRVFENSLEKGKPFDLRIGGGSIIKGLDEGISSMKTGGLRRLYVPGNSDLGFTKGLKRAAGRQSIAPKAALVIDVELIYVPGQTDSDLF